MREPKQEIHVALYRTEHRSINVHVWGGIGAMQRTVLRAVEIQATAAAVAEFIRAELISELSAGGLAP